MSQNLCSVGTYEFSKCDLIGHGACAIIYKGRHKLNKNVVAIKCIDKARIHKHISKGIHKEITILKNLQHKSIVQLLDYQESPHHLFIVMEFCNGGDLSQYLIEKGTLSEDTIRLFLKQIAAAMIVLYSRGVVHRDIKPQNLLLSHAVAKPKPHEIAIKIADFGFARHLHNSCMSATLCGTPWYMAPEVVTRRLYDASADLWSIGVVVYECLVGHVPFRVPSSEQLCNIYGGGGLQSPSSFNTTHYVMNRAESLRVAAIAKMWKSLPHGTSDDLSDLLHGLLRLDPSFRISFPDFFNHRFVTTVMKRASRSRSLSSRRSSHPSTAPSSGRSKPQPPVSHSVMQHVEPTTPFLTSTSSLDDHEFVERSMNLFASVSFSSPLSRRTGDFPKVSPASPPPADGSHEPFVFVSSSLQCSDQVAPGSGGRSISGYIRETASQSSPPRCTPQGTPPSHPMCVGWVSYMFDEYGRTPCPTSSSMGSSICPPNMEPSLVPLPVPTQFENHKEVVWRSRSSSRSAAGRQPNIRAASSSAIRSNKSSVCNRTISRDHTLPKVISSSLSFDVIDVEVMRFQCQFADAIYDVANEHVLLLDCLLTSQCFASQSVTSNDEFALDPLYSATRGQRHVEQIILLLRSQQILSSLFRAIMTENQTGQLCLTSAMTQLVLDLVERIKKTHLRLLAIASKCDPTTLKQLNLKIADRLLYHYVMHDCHLSVLLEVHGGRIEACVETYERAAVLTDGLAFIATHPFDKLTLGKHKIGILTRLNNLTKLLSWSVR